MKKYFSRKSEFMKEIDGKKYTVTRSEYELNITCKKFKTALGNFLRAYPQLEEWRELYEWMHNNNSTNENDQLTNLNTFNQFWHFALNLDIEEDGYYIAITLMDYVEENTVTPLPEETENILPSDHAHKCMPIDSYFKKMLYEAYVAMKEIDIPEADMIHDYIKNEIYCLSSYKTELDFWRIMDGRKIPYSHDIFVIIRNYLDDLRIKDCEVIKEQFGETDETLAVDHAREYMPLDANLLNMFRLAAAKIPNKFHTMIFDAIRTKEYKLGDYNEEWDFWHEMERLKVPCANKIFLKIADYMAELATGKKKEHDSHCSTSIPGVKDLDDIIEDMRKNHPDIDKKEEISLRKVCKMYRDIGKKFYSQKHHIIANALEILLFYAEHDNSDIPVVIFKKGGQII